MTKNEVNKYLQVYLASRGMDGNWGHRPESETLMQLFEAIIDALPDEPPHDAIAEMERKDEETRRRIRGGPEPVAEKVSEPTSAFPQQPIVETNGVRHFKENRMIRYILNRSKEDMNTLYDAPFSIEERCQFAQLIGYTVDGYNELSYTTVALGQRSEGTAAASGATQFPRFDPCPLILPEDARKLRIMKAMEDIAASTKNHARFGFEEGVWVCHTVFGEQRINDCYDPVPPPEPLWEGEMLLESGTPNLYPYVSDTVAEILLKKPGWRKIRVREMRDPHGVA